MKNSIVLSESEENQYLSQIHKSKIMLPYANTVSANLNIESCSYFTNNQSTASVLWGNVTSYINSYSQVRHTMPFIHLIITQVSIKHLQHGGGAILGMYQ